MKRVLTCSVTAAGAATARRLPYEHLPGRLLERVKDEWRACDGLVLVAPVGLAVRAVAPLLGSKESDPGVVSVDDSGSFVVALTGGHACGANQLALEVASLLGATPVVTTATDRSGLPALDSLPGYMAAGDVAGVTRRWLDGEEPSVGADPALARWPLPPSLAGVAGHGGTVTITDSSRAPRGGEVLLRPRSVVVGVGASTGADERAFVTLVASLLERAGVDDRCAATVATLDRKAGDPAVAAVARGLGAEIKAFPSTALAGVQVPHPSDAVAEAVGTPSVAEAAALLAAGPGAVLVWPKSVSATGDSTAALARRMRPAGHLAVVGIGAGSPRPRTPEATAAIRHAEVIVGYATYVDLVADLLSPSQVVLRSPIGSETERCRLALERAASGEQVALVCSGDPGVYGLASLVCELAPQAGDPPVSVVPGVTAALSAASLLGAPLGHDHAAISLSDLLTPWDVVRLRLVAAAEGDFVVSLYNPRSSKRDTQLREALDILSVHRPASTPAAILTDVGRPGEKVVRATIASLDPEQAGMTSLVVVGSTETLWIGDRMVTPRGYKPTC